MHQGSYFNVDMWREICVFLMSKVKSCFKLRPDISYNVPLIKYFELQLENILDQRINETSESHNDDSYFYISSILYETTIWRTIQT